MGINVELAMVEVINCESSAYKLKEQIKKCDLDESTRFILNQIDDILRTTNGMRKTLSSMKTKQVLKG